MQITDLYQTQITCSTYNANIDSTDTVITVKLIDFNGAAVTNKSVTLTCDKGYFNKNGSTTISGTSTKSITATTDSSGEITATWTASEWGLCTFSTNSSNIQVNVIGWRTAWSDSNYHVVYNNNLVSASIFYGSNVNYTTNVQEFGAEVLKHGSIDLRPKMPMIQMSTYGDYIYIADNSYKMKYFRLSGTHSAGAYASFTYKRR